MENCIFCKIINKEIPSGMIFENENIVVFKDVNPKAPVHFLVVPKKHVISVNETEEVDKEVLGELFLIAKKVAKENGISDSGYKLSVNVGEGAGQEVPHLHLHLVGGWKN
jgi:histidine triad (HIT) family protein